MKNIIVFLVFLILGHAKVNAGCHCTCTAQLAASGESYNNKIIKDFGQVQWYNLVANPVACDSKCRELVEGLAGDVSAAQAALSQPNRMPESTDSYNVPIKAVSKACNLNNRTSATTKKARYNLRTGSYSCVGLGAGYVLDPDINKCKKSFVIETGIENQTLSLVNGSKIQEAKIISNTLVIIKEPIMQNATPESVTIL